MRILATALCLAVAACAPAATENQAANSAANTQEARMVAPILTGEDARDPHSYARPEVARVTHVALDLGLDFEGKRVSGTSRQPTARRRSSSTARGWRSKASPTPMAARRCNIRLAR
jgi:hypothetical protein